MVVARDWISLAWTWLMVMRAVICVLRVITSCRMKGKSDAIVACIRDRVSSRL